MDSFSRPSFRIVKLWRNPARGSGNSLVIDRHQYPANGIRGRLQDEAFQLRELLSFTLRATRLPQIRATLIEPILTDSLSRKLTNNRGTASFRTAAPQSPPC